MLWRTDGGLVTEALAQGRSQNFRKRGAGAKKYFPISAFLTCELDFKGNHHVCTLFVELPELHSVALGFSPTHSQYRTVLLETAR